MLVIFVRHAETGLSKTHQLPGTELSGIGVKQANLLSARLKELKTYAIVSSSYERAIQTANVLSKNLNVPVQYSELFNEIKKPSEFNGKQHGRREGMDYFKRAVEHAEDPTWHYSDEENYTEIKDRAMKAIEYLIGMKKDHVVVISHGTMIKTIVAIGVFGSDIDIVALRKFYKAFTTENTGITECEMDGNGTFKVLRFNDHSHL